MANTVAIRNAALLTLLAISSITLTWKAKSLEKGFATHSDEPAMANRQAPEFQAHALSGDPISASSFKGNKRIVVSFWASWCEPCRMELPELKSFYEKYHGADSSFEVVAISTDEDRFQAEKYVKEAKLPFPVVWDENGTIAEAYGVDSIPVLYVIDEHGKVIYGQTGYTLGMQVKLKTYLRIKEDGPNRVPSDGNSGN